MAKVPTRRGGELLDHLADIVASRGFGNLRIADLSRELHCSAATLYALAPNKSELVVLAVARVGDRALERIEECVAGPMSATDRARTYFLAGAHELSGMSNAFRTDTDSLASTRLAWQSISERYIDRFSELLREAANAGEIRDVNAAFMGRMLRQMALVTRIEVLGNRTNAAPGMAVEFTELDRGKREKIEVLATLLKGALEAEGKVGLKMNVPRSKLEQVSGQLPSLHTPTISSQVDPEWVALEVILDKQVSRSLIPRLKKAGAEGIVEYPLNKVIY